jgi:hypothetical protein
MGHMACQHGSCVPDKELSTQNQACFHPGLEAADTVAHNCVTDWNTSHKTGNACAVGWILGKQISNLQSAELSKGSY